MLISRITNCGRITIPSMKKFSSQPLVLQTMRTAQCIDVQDLSEGRQIRLLHTSHVRRDMESAFKAIAAGIAITGVIGPGIGIGIVFGNLAAAGGRNPSAVKQLLNVAIIGAAFCEALALFATLVSFMVMFS